jgi:flagellar biogenesis protein FliO
MDGTLELNLLTTGLKTTAMLFIVLGLLVSVLYLVKKSQIFRRVGKGDPIIKVLSSQHLSPRVKIEVVEILGEKIVLGLTPGSISFLTKLDKSTSALTPWQTDLDGKYRQETGVEGDEGGHS